MYIKYSRSKRAKFSNTELYIHFQLKRDDHVCLKCGVITNKVHDYRTSIIKDAPILGKDLFLHYSNRHYCYTSCNARFLERFTLLPKHCRLATCFIFLVIDQLKSNSVRFCCCQINWHLHFLYFLQDG